MSNSRVIHGIISVPNRADIKRNQIYNSEYQQLLRDYQDRVSETCIKLNCMIQKPLETKQVKDGDKINKEDSEEKTEKVEETNHETNENTKLEKEKEEGVTS